jgi:DNA-binding FadR family transcriptional regulator
LDKDVLKEHEAIYEAIKEKNIDHAREAAESHLIKAMSRLMKETQSLSS